jgi:hypothetical protein
VDSSRHQGSDQSDHQSEPSPNEVITVLCGVGGGRRTKARNRLGFGLNLSETRTWVGWFVDAPFGGQRMFRLGRGILAVVGMTGLLALVPAHAQQQRSGSAAPTVRLAPMSDADADQNSTNGTAESNTNLAKKLQNPIGDLISIPFQSNTNFNVGPNKGTQEILNIQPVVPFHLNDNWNLITRTILPLVWSPSYQPGQSVPFGLAATSFSAFLSPKNPVDGWVWGVGPVAQLPTITSRTLGSNVWGLGPAVVVVKLAGPVVAGGLVNNVFSLGGRSGPAGTSYSLFTINPFFNYNFGGGWFAGTAPIITANWQSNGAKWTLPVGAQGGRLIKIGGKLPVNLVIGAYYNALRPQFSGTWQLRTQIAFIF